MIASLDSGSVVRYRRWRAQWHSGRRSQAMIFLIHHGLADALARTATRTPSPARPAAPPNGKPIVEQAAWMVWRVHTQQLGSHSHA